jgi:deoxyribonuclease V
LCLNIYEIPCGAELMRIYHLHDWNVTPGEAIALQRALAGQLDWSSPVSLSAVQLVAGVDVSVQTAFDGHAQSQAAVVVLRLSDMSLVETVTAEMPTPFPYIPGLLTFREGPVLELAFEQLQAEPDVFIFDGMGRAHPRRIGIAAHLGLWLEKPTIGCGKTLFVGRYNALSQERGAWAPLVDRGEVIGAALRTRPNANPVFISAGHRIDLESSLQLVMACTGRFRLPEPIRAAHRAAGAMRF